MLQYILFLIIKITVPIVILIMYTKRILNLLFILISQTRAF